MLCDDSPNLPQKQKQQNDHPQPEKHLRGNEYERVGNSIRCGFNCKNAEVYFPADPAIVFNIWYTNEIKLKNPNSATPFNQIDGVLMDFFFIMGESQLHFLAETVYQKDIPEETFLRRDNFQRVSRDDIKKVMGTMLSL